MDLLEFLASIVDSLAWPVSTLLLAWVIVAVFKKPLVELIHRVRKISHGDSVVEMSEQVQQLKVELSESVQQLETESLPPIGISQRDRFTIRNDPRALPIEAWLRAESAARQLLLANDVNDEIGSPSEVLRRLRSENLIRQLEHDSLRTLLSMRNRAVHEPDFDIDPEMRDRFVELTEEVMRVIFGSSNP